MHTFAHTIELHRSAFTLAPVAHREIPTAFHLSFSNQLQRTQPLTNNTPPNTKIPRCATPRFRGVSLRLAPPSQYNRNVHGDRRDLLCPRAQRRRRRSVVPHPPRVRHSAIPASRLLSLFLPRSGSN